MKKTFLFFIEQGKSGNSALKEQALAFCDNSSVYENLEFIEYDKHSDFDEIFRNAKEKGIENAYINLIETNPIYNVKICCSAIKCGFSLNDILIDIDLIKPMKKQASITRVNPPMETRSNKAVGIFYGLETPEMDKWFSDFCDLNNLEYVGFINFSDDNFMEKIDKMNVGTALVAGPNDILSETDHLTTLINFCEKRIEIVDAITGKSITDYCASIDFTEDNKVEKKVFVLTFDDDTDIIQETANYAIKKGYDIYMGCSIKHHTSFEDMLPELLHMVKSSNSTIIVIPNKKSFPFSQQEWNEFLIVLDDCDIKVESIEEGTLYPENTTQSMNLMN